ncbi:NUDIX hydrolase [Dietzia alimentaria]|uniref:NUDIX hydrolase n=1 Tax=Dietzia alimentaria TaxID=665550 RepID=UPI00029A8DF3|nr:NUDIX hydrolase [Dietzia alimentaria]
MSAELLVLVVVISLAVVAALLVAYLTAHRLDRLHIRTDQARTALAGALERRHTAATAIARDVATRDPCAAERITTTVAAARTHRPGAIAGTDPAPDPDRRDWRARPHAPEAEHAENALGMVLSTVDVPALPPDLAAEFEDVTDRVAMARRFYNDAVRDTRGLREKIIVRALRLAGRAPMPDYVELVDPPAPDG